MSKPPMFAWVRKRVARQCLYIDAMYSAVVR